MCMHWMMCLCWRDIKSPSVAIGVFALATSLIQIVIAISKFITMQVDMKDAANPLYITLACFDFIVVVLSILLLIGFERDDTCYHWFRVFWVIWIFLYILYESTINIYYFSIQFNGPQSSKLMGFLVVFIVYWSGKEIILFTGWLFIVSHLCYGDSLVVSYSDKTIGPMNYNGGMANYNGGMAIYNGGVANCNGGMTKVQIQDNSRSAVSHFDVIRPTSGYQVYGPNCGRGGGCGYPGQDYYLPSRYM